MKRKAPNNGLSGPRKRQLVNVSQSQSSAEPNGDRTTSPGKGFLESRSSDQEHMADDNESLFTESDNSSNSNEPPAQTAPTSIAPSTNSRAGRKFPSDLKKIPCPEPGCGKTFNRPARLTAHLRSHSNDRPFKCTEPSCDKSYMEEKHLRQHIKGSHSQERKYLCGEPGCGKSFLTGTRLRRHAAVHEGANRFRCSGYEGCEQSFRKHQTLQRHVRTVHLGQRAYVCGTDGCKEDFDSPNALKRHVERDHGELRFWCDECGGQDGEENGRVGFTTLQLLQAHSREMHVGCPFCDVKCSGQWELEKHHDDFHSGKTVEDRKTVSCTWEGCPKTFVKVSNLNAHIKTAHERVRLVCGQVDTFGWSEDMADWNWMEEGCGDTFINKMKLEEHIRFIHLGKKRQPFLYPDPTATSNAVTDLSGLDDTARRNLACTVDGCDARFIRYHDLGVHMQKAHNNGYGEQDIESLEVAARPQRAFQPAPPAQSLVPVDPYLQTGDDRNSEQHADDGVFWFGGDFPEEQNDDTFERDMVDMRMLIDMDALVDDEQTKN